MTKKDIDKYGKVGWTTYFRKFGSFQNAVLKACLKPSRRTGTSDKELLDALLDLWAKTLSTEGRRPFASDLKKYGFDYSKDNYRRRFGSFRKALILANNSITEDSDLTNRTPLDVSVRLDLSPLPRFARKEISIRKRFLILKRDQFACSLCGRSGAGVKLEVDHKAPVSKGGTNNLDNLRTLCFECNRGKRNDSD